MFIFIVHFRMQLLLNWWMKKKVKIYFFNGHQKIDGTIQPIFHDEKIRKM